MGCLASKEHVVCGCQGPLQQSLFSAFRKADFFNSSLSISITFLGQQAQTLYVVKSNNGFLPSAKQGIQKAVSGLMPALSMKTVRNKFPVKIFLFATRFRKVSELFNFSV